MIIIELKNILLEDLNWKLGLIVRLEDFNELKSGFRDIIL